MPTMSVYVFERSAPSDAGRFWQNHVTHGPGAWAWASISSIGHARSALAWERPDGEDVLDLSAVANNPIALGVVDGLLSGGASRRGPVRTSYVTWARVHPGVRASDPNRHQPWELLATLNIDMHIGTPWYCSDADGTITYYIFFFLDAAGQLRGTVDGWSFRYDGGGPFCTGTISSRLRTAVSGGMSTVQAQIDTGVALFARSRRFYMLYYLPGHGERSGAAVEDNADNNVALAVLPR